MVEATIRAFEMSDWEAVAELWLLPNCQLNTLQMPYESRDAIKKKLENPPPRQHSLVATINNSQKVVGIVDLQVFEGRRSHAGELEMCVHDDYQNQGIGSKLMEAAINLAERWLNLKRLELIVYCDNAAAICLYEKHGFAIEGTLRKYAFRDGVYTDAYLMARLAN